VKNISIAAMMNIISARFVLLFFFINCNVCIPVYKLFYFYSITACY
jgi:hypothetical protein